MEKTNYLIGKTPDLYIQDIETISNILGKPYHERIKEQFGVRGFIACVSRLQLNIASKFNEDMARELSRKLRKKFYDKEYRSI